MRLLRRLGLGALLGCPLILLADNRSVTVVTDMTSLGRKAPQPAPGHAIYYLPHVRGYQEIGSKVGAEKQPDQHQMVHLVATQLAHQGYLVANGQHPPDIFLAMIWGRISPSADVVDQGVGISDDITSTDGNMALADDRVSTLEQAIVLGHTAFNVIDLETPGHQQYMEMANESRYFIIVSAFDVKRFQTAHKRELLWTTKISVPTGANYFPDFVDGMVKAGAASFGKETNGHPTILSIVPEGSVHVGTPTVKE